MINGGSVKAVAMKDVAWKMGHGPFANEMYYFLLCNKEVRLNYLDAEHLNALLKYSNSRDLSERIFLELRRRVFGQKRTNSFIVNEIVGVAELISSGIEYIKLTINMRKKLNGK